jgi:hypothetical protein
MTMTKQEKEELLAKRAASMQWLEADEKGIEFINKSHEDALKAAEDALERIKKIRLPKGAKSNKELKRTALMHAKRAVFQLQALRKLEKRGDEDDWRSNYNVKPPKHRLTV